MFGETYSRPCWTYWSETDRRNCRDEAAGIVTTQEDLDRAAEIQQDTQARIELQVSERQRQEQQAVLARQQEDLRRREEEAAAGAAALQVAQKQNNRILAAAGLIAVVAVYFIFFRG